MFLGHLVISQRANGVVFGSFVIEAFCPLSHSDPRQARLRCVPKRGCGEVVAKSRRRSGSDGEKQRGWDFFEKGFFGFLVFSLFFFLNCSNKGVFCGFGLFSPFEGFLARFFVGLP